jgi:hypothetical protein
MMKKIIGTAFLCILLLQVAGSYVYFIVRLSGIRSEMREQLKYKPDDELTLLLLSRDEYKKSKVDDHEVKVNGRMYDIARMIVKGDHFFIYALHDEAEDNLLSLLHEMVKRTSKDKKPVPSSLIHLLTLQFVAVENVTLTTGPIAIDHITPYVACTSFFDTGIDTPPPRG